MRAAGQPGRDRDMSAKTYAAIAGVGHYAPAKVLTNADLEKMVETSDEWIQTRTGIRERRIAAAGLDVFEGEPRVHPDLLAVPNVVLTPHIASATRGTRLAMAQLAADNLIEFLTSGRARTPVNPEVLR